MLPYDKALSLIIDVTSDFRLQSESILLENSQNRILAENLTCSEDNPLFDNSAMDGFAISSKRTEGVSERKMAEFPIFKILGAGDRPVENAPPGTAVEIMTGAVMPSGEFDSVLRVEDSQVTGEGEDRKLLVSRAVTRGENVRKRGSDFVRGEKLLSKGVTIGPRELMAAATFGIRQVKVVRRPKVLLISTGKEIVDFRTEELAPGQIRNSTAPYILESLRTLGCDAEYLGIVDDQKTDLTRAFGVAFESGVDLVLSTGGVSVGRFDWVDTVLKEFSVTTHFHKCAIRPGKPILFGNRNKTFVFGIPGNPISTAVAMRFFVSPFLRALKGLEPEVFRRAKLVDSVRKPVGLKCFFRAVEDLQSGQCRVKVLTGQESYRLRASLDANAWAILPEELSEVKAGDEVEVCSVYGN